ncbi:hypothetical protein C0J52_08992 [Blattella germanica]|nr:hypothetical protein C0J52_08992 [Blattella germanica]
MVTCEIGLLLLMILIQGTLTKECAQKKYGERNMVCVCNATYCDTVEYDVETEPLAGKAIRFTSSEGGLRFYKSGESFHSLDSFNPDLIPPSKLYVNISQQYQVILGFGASLTDAAGINIASLKKNAQDMLLRSYFTEEGIGYTQVKVPMAANEYSNRSYTYADVANDNNLKNFRLVKEDYKYKSAELAQWLACLPLIPAGFLQAYEKEGIKFWAMSAQNDPYLGTAWSVQPVPESMGWSNNDLKVWIRDYLVPTLGNKNYSYIKILGLDSDSSSLSKWSREVMDDTAVKNYITGIALHWYTDNRKNFPDILRSTHESYPEKFILYNDASLGFQECDQENIQNWLECDVDDPGHQVLTNDEIIASIIDDQDLCDEEEEPSDEDCAEKGPSSEEAFHCLETAMKWVEQEEECDAVQLLCLKRLRDLAAKKQVLKNWASGWMESTMVVNTYGGPSFLDKVNDAAIIVNSTANEFYKQPTYYIIGHFSRFIPPDSVRIDLRTEYPNDVLEAVAFLTPNGTIVINVINNTKEITTTAASTTTTTIESTTVKSKTRTTTTTKTNETTIITESTDYTEETADTTNSPIEPTISTPRSGNGTASSILLHKWHLYTLLIPVCVQLYLFY